MFAIRLKQQIDAMQARFASQWLEVLKEGRADEVAAFNDWCRESPLHIREFLEVAFVEGALAEHRFDADEGSDELLALLRQASVSQGAVPLSRPPAAGAKSKPRRRWWPGTLVAAAAVTCLALGATIAWESWQPRQEFSTAIGEQRTIKLVDASVVTLNTDSDIRITFERGARNVELLRGEAIFKVAHDANRPFQVHTRAGSVQAVGTQFNVYDRKDATVVSVIEGRVRLSAAHATSTKSVPPEELAAGEEARIGLDGAIRKVRDPDVASATAWSNRRLRFDNTSLEDMIDEFNRYQRHKRFRVVGVAPGSHHYSGIFDPDAPDAFANFFAHERDLTVDIGESEIVIRPRGNGDKEPTED